MQVVQAASNKRSVSLAEHASELVEQTVPLIQMSGSSKKRKHNELEDDTDYHPNYSFPENNLHTPVPNIKKQNRWRKRGNKQFFIYNEPESNRRTDDCPNNQQQQRHQNKKGKKRKNKGNNSETQQHQQNYSQRTVQPKKKQKQQQSEPFDYNSVDYSQFRGGGKSVSGTQKPNTSFKNKVRNLMYILFFIFILMYIVLFKILCFIKGWKKAK